MDPIEQALKRFAGGRFEQQLQKLRQEVMADRRIQDFMKDHPEVGAEALEVGLNELYQYKEQWKNCDNCPGLEACPNLMQGYQPKLEVQRGYINMSYHACPLKRKDDERKRHASFMKSLYLPKEMLSVTFDDFKEDHPTRINAFAKALEFCSSVDPGQGAASGSVSPACAGHPQPAATPAPSPAISARRLIQAARGVISRAGGTG